MSQYNELKETENTLKEEPCDVNRKMNERFDTIDRKFEAIDERFDIIDKKFEDVYGRFDVIDENFEAVYMRFGNVDEEIKDLHHTDSLIFDELERVHTILLDNIRDNEKRNRSGSFI